MNLRTFTVLKGANFNKQLVGSEHRVLPHGHLAVGYLAVSGVMRVAWGRTPDWRSILVVILGTQLPDLIDKPLSLLVGGAFATGRTVGHSVLISIPVVLCLGLVFRDQRERQLLVATFAITYVTHPFADAALFVSQGTVVRDIVEMSFVVWPVELPAERIVGFLSQSATVERLIVSKPLWTARHLPRPVHINPYVRASEIVLASLATITWLHDDAPGLEIVQSKVERVYRLVKGS